MTTAPLSRPHFRKPPIFEQAIALVFDRLRDFSIVDPGLFWTEIREQFPLSESAPRLPTSVELFDGPEAQLTFSALPPVQLPRTVFKTNPEGELVQIQDDKFVFNWVRTSQAAQYPRFERTSARLWELYTLWAKFYEKRYGTAPPLKQCELTNVNVVEVKDFGDDFADMHRAFVVDPFEWNVPGLVAETYVRQRVHRLVDENGDAIGRLHSVITPVFGPSNQKAFHFELTARSSPNIKTEDQARDFFEHAHVMINAAFMASVTKHMLSVWGEKKHGE